MCAHPRSPQGGLHLPLPVNHCRPSHVQATKWPLLGQRRGTGHQHGEAQGTGGAAFGAVEPRPAGPPAPRWLRKGGGTSSLATSDVTVGGRRSRQEREELPPVLPSAGSASSTTGHGALQRRSERRKRGDRGGRLEGDRGDQWKNDGIRGRTRGQRKNFGMRPARISDQSVPSRKE